MNSPKALEVQRPFDFGRFAVKITAITTMTVDHVGAVLFPNITVLRMIGRLAFPMFLYLLILGVKSTGNAKGYFLRLLFFGLVSQTPYFLAFGIGPFDRLNIFFTLLFGGLSVYLFYKGNPLALLPVLATVLLNAEGTYYALAFVACIGLLEINSALGVLSSALLNLPYLLEGDIQALSLLALPVIVLHKHGFFNVEKKMKQNSAYFSWMKYFFYVYYPLHLTLLFLIRNYLF